MNTTVTTPLPYPDYNFKYDFSLAQAQIMAAGVLGHDLSRNHVADLLRPQLLDPQSTLSIVKRKHRLKFDDAELLDKLECLPFEKLKALQELLAVITALNPWDLFAGDLPSVHVLRRFGLAPPVDRPIWGLIVVRFDNHVEEIVLRDPPDPTDFGQFSAAHLAIAILGRITERRQGMVSSPDVLLKRLCFELAHVTDSRFVSVIEDGEDVSVAAIPIEALRSDVENGSLRDLVIPGVNAPPMAMS